jgi:SPP1 family predicted phage head-tail adaptor
MQCAKSCKSNGASAFKHRIAFQATTQTSDGAGGFTEQWATVATVWASIEPARSFEKFVAMQTETHVTHKIMCRYNPLITTAKRALFEGRIFDVTGVINVNEDKQYMQIMATEGTL